MAKAAKPRLGRGLSSLISSSLEVDVPTLSPELGGGEPGSTTDPDARRDHPDVRYLPIAQIEPSPFQPRNEPEDADLNALAASIASLGVMQPIAARARTAGGWELVAGERRWRAARLAGLERIPAHVIDIDDVTAAEWALAENLQREDLSPIEQGWAMRRLAEQFEQTHAQIAERIGIARATVTNLVRLTELEPQIQKLLSSNDISAGHAKVLLSVEDTDKRLALAKRIVGDSLSVRALEQLAQNVPTPRKHSKNAEHEIPPNIVELEKQLAEHLGSKVRVRTSKDGKRGSITIEFYGPDGFDDIARRIGFTMRS